MAEAITTSAVMNARQAAAYLGMHVVTLRRLAQRGDITYIQRVPNGRLSFEQRDLDVYLERHKQRPAS